MRINELSLLAWLDLAARCQARVTNERWAKGRKNSAPQRSYCHKMATWTLPAALAHWKEYVRGFWSVRLFPLSPFMLWPLILLQWSRSLFP